ncbi:MAG TPA: hypothetical protein PLI09_15605 [Candidatus Hydrogenedentes bacterium]|nr:hypothetical protein [Candidatus Hydrogenedentota bacterium]
MKGKWHFLYPIFALFLQPLPILFIQNMGSWTFEQPQWLPESWVWPVSILGLFVSTVMSFGLACLGTYTLLTRSRLIIAIIMIVLFCIPAFLAGAVYLYALLVFLTWV